MTAALDLRQINNVTNNLANNLINNVINKEKS
jgi:hypothetical protein